MRLFMDGFFRFSGLGGSRVFPERVDLEYFSPFFLYII